MIENDEFRELIARIVREEIKVIAAGDKII